MLSRGIWQKRYLLNKIDKRYLLNKTNKTSSSAAAAVVRLYFSSNVDLQTKLAQAGCKKENRAGNYNEDTNLTPPIHFSTTFEREKDLSYTSHIYSRTSNPTRNLLEETIADLENGTECASFSSGSAATSSLLTAIGPNL